MWSAFAVLKGLGPLAYVGCQRLSDCPHGCVPRRLRRSPPDMKQPIVSRSTDVMGGTAVFHGTRVPVQTLLDYLEAGESIDDFLEGFPSVTRERVIAFLEEAKDRVIEAAS
jgi:uncharacterized protein (DUF433 family)